MSGLNEIRTHNRVIAATAEDAEALPLLKLFHKFKQHGNKNDKKWHLT